jgi:KipI family sensor histidine kinase inhibitor
VIRQFGEEALLVEVEGDEAGRRAARIAALAAAVRDRAGNGVVAAVPGLRSLLVRYDPDLIDAAQLGERLRSLLAMPAAPAPDVRERTIPVCYDGEDLAGTARLLGLDAAALAERHAALTLTVMFLGFAPGFPYLGEAPAEMEVPRLATPRASTPAGSVALAGRMTGIYPNASPGGWRVIGRTPLRLFDPDRDPPAYLRSGDRVRFRAVSSEEMAAIDPLPLDW